MQKLFMKCILEENLIQISDKLSSETLNANSEDQNAENIIENTEKSLFDLAERGSFLNHF